MIPRIREGSVEAWQRSHGRRESPLEIEQIELEGPRAGECLVRLAATGVCHTDAYTLSGKDPEGLFPAVLGHEGAGEVVEVGAGVRSLARRRPRDPALHSRVSRVQVLSVRQDEPVRARSARRRARA